MELHPLIAAQVKEMEEDVANNDRDIQRLIDSFSGDQSFLQNMVCVVSSLGILAFSLLSPSFSLTHLEPISFAQLNEQRARAQREFERRRQKRLMEQKHERDMLAKELFDEENKELEEVDESKFRCLLFVCFSVFPDLRLWLDGGLLWRDGCSRVQKRTHAHTNTHTHTQRKRNAQAPGGFGGRGGRRGGEGPCPWRL